MNYRTLLLFFFLVGATAKTNAKEDDISPLDQYLLRKGTAFEKKKQSINQERKHTVEAVNKWFFDAVFNFFKDKYCDDNEIMIQCKDEETPLTNAHMKENGQMQSEDPIGCFEEQSSIDSKTFSDMNTLLDDCSQYCSTYFFGLVGFTCKCFSETPAKRLSISSCCNIDHDGVRMDVYFKSSFRDQCDQDITRNVRNQLVQENNADLGFDIVRNTFLPSPFKFYNNGCGTNIYDLKTDVSGNSGSMTTVSNVLEEYAMEKRSHISQSIGVSASAEYDGMFGSASVKASASFDSEMNSAFQSSGASEVGSKRFSSFGVQKLSEIDLENFHHKKYFATFNDEFIEVLKRYITSGYQKDVAKEIFNSFGMVVVEYGVVGGYVQISATSKSSDLSQYFSSETEMEKCYETAVSGSAAYGPVSGSFSAEASGCSGEALSLMKSVQEQFSSEASETNYVGGSIVPVVGSERDVFSVTPETAKLLTNADMYDDGDGMRLRLITDFLHPDKVSPLEIKRHLLTEEQFEEAQKHLQDHCLEILTDIGDILDDCSPCDGVPYLEETDDFTCDCYEPLDPSIDGDLQPPVNDYKVWLDGKSWNGNTWFDKSSNKYHPGIHGTINTAIEEDKNMTYLYGDRSSGVTVKSGWPSGSEYTFFHVTKYDNAPIDRIWTGTTGNWVSGHNNGKKGLFFHEGWVTQYSKSVGDARDWSIFTDRVNSVGTNVRVDGIDLTINPTFNYIPDAIGINVYAYSSQDSDWAAALVLIYDRYLDDNEVLSVETWIKTEYLHGDI